MESDIDVMSAFGPALPQADQKSFVRSMKPNKRRPQWSSRFFIRIPEFMFLHFLIELAAIALLL